MIGVDELGTRTAAPLRAVGDGALLRLIPSMPDRRDDVLAVLNGLIGDALDDDASPHAIPMTIRLGSTILPLEKAGLSEALRAAGGEVSPRICVFVHGLMSTESIWQFPTDAEDSSAGLLAAEHGLTPLTLRYNTGRHISTNGRELADLLSRLVAAWPVRVEEIDLIGHSMGGLVIRSACWYARTVRARGRRFPIGRRWTSRVRRIVLLGTPNTGAPLEVFVNMASAALWSLPVPPARLLGAGLDRRSAGIRDLRFGALHDEDWLEQDPDARRRPRPHRVHRLRRARYLTIAGVIGSDPEHPLARLVGDALVGSSSAWGRTDGSDEPDLFPGATSAVLPGVNHVALARHPDVFRTIGDWW